MVHLPWCHPLSDRLRPVNQHRVTLGLPSFQRVRSHPTRCSRSIAHKPATRCSDQHLSMPIRVTPLCPYSQRQDFSILPGTGNEVDPNPMTIRSRSRPPQIKAAIIINPQRINIRSAFPRCSLRCRCEISMKIGWTRLFMTPRPRRSLLVHRILPYVLSIHPISRFDV